MRLFSILFLFIIQSSLWADNLSLVEVVPSTVIYRIRQLKDTKRKQIQDRIILQTTVDGKLELIVEGTSGTAEVSLALKLKGVRPQGLQFVGLDNFQNIVTVYFSPISKGISVCEVSFESHVEDVRLRKYYSRKLTVETIPVDENREPKK